MVVHQLLAQRTGRARLKAVWLATLLAWAYFTRPTSAISLAAVGVYFFFVDRRALPRFAGTLVIWILLFFAYSWYHFGRLLPRYFDPDRLGSDTFWMALAANLVSPARGLLIFVPQILLIAHLLARYRAFVAHRVLVALSLAVVGLHWLAVSGFPHWWGGYCYGPRLMTDVIPWLALLAIVGARAWLDGRSPEPIGLRLAGVTFARAVSVVLILFAVVVHAGAALTPRGKYWYQYPQHVRDHRWRLWDWKDPQVLSWMRQRPKRTIPDPGRGVHSQ